MTLLLMNSILLIAANIFLSVIVAKSINLTSGVARIGIWLKKGGSKERMPFYLRDTAESASNMSMLKRMSLTFIIKSNVRRYIPFMNIYILFAGIIIGFIAVYQPVNRMLGFLPSSVIISGVIASIPLFILDILARYNSEAVRKMLSEYISVLSRWCSVKEDIMYAFEKSLESNIGEPLRTFIEELVIQVNRGMDTSAALNMLQLKVDNLYFKDFIINIKQCIINRGDTIKLLTNLENQFYKIDEEYNRRRISTYKDRMLVYLIMFAVLLLAYLFINFTPQIRSFYLETLEGKLLLTMFSCMYAVGFYLTARIMKFR